MQVGVVSSEEKSGDLSQLNYIISLGWSCLKPLASRNRRADACRRTARKLCTRDKVLWTYIYLSLRTFRTITRSINSSHRAGVGGHGEGVDVEARSNYAQENGVYASREPTRAFVESVCMFVGGLLRSASRRPNKTLGVAWCSAKVELVYLFNGPCCLWCFNLICDEVERPSFRGW